MNPKFKEIDLVNVKIQFWNKLTSKVDHGIINKVIHQVMDPIWYNTTLTLTLDFMDSYES